MEGTFIINDSSNSFVTNVVPELNITAIDYYDLRTDKDFSIYIRTIFASNNIRKLIIPVSLGQSGNNHLGLKLGIHIRVSLESSIDPLIPIVFVSNKSLETLLIEPNDKYGLLTVTTGCALVPEDVQELRAQITALERITPEKLVPDVLDNLIIDKPLATGPHSLANEWGVIRLDQITQLHALQPTDVAFQRKDLLYFKYQAALNKALSFRTLPGGAPSANPSPSVPNYIDASGEHILYIDDEGDKGWVTVLERLFRGAHFEAITGKGLSEGDFFTAIHRAIQSDRTLILLDLRLLPNQEDIHGKLMPVTEYSGTKILQRIKTLNPGTQVIIFTASNKAWNMKELQDLGADGYFIKESPDYLVPDHLSLYNYEAFKKQAKNSFRRVFLRNIYQAHQAAINETAFHDQSFLTLSEAGLNTAFKLIELELLDAAYLTYFQVMERYAEICLDPANLPTTDPTNNMLGTNLNKTRALVIEADPTGFNYCEIRAATANVSVTKALSMLSFVMAFKFRKDNAYLKHIGMQVTKRNNIAHDGSGGATIQDCFELVDIIKMFRSS